MTHGLPQPGEDFDGKYTIEETLGEGGMGVVFRATHRRLSQAVAIKVLHPEMLAHPDIVQRFEREARAAAQLRSRHAVRVIDVGERDDLPFIVMEHLRGQDLAHELERVGRLSVGDAVHWVLQVCSAMAEAHARGIVHRDLKPENLFLAEEEAGERVVKVLDFGISKLQEASSSSITATQASMGTPLYMSPEQVRSSKDVDARADIWSLGVILYELVCGQPPFTGTPAAVGAAIVSDDPVPPRALRPELPVEFERVIARALAKRRDDRFPDVRAFADALAPWATRTAVDGFRTGPNLAIAASVPGLEARSGDSLRAPTLLDSSVRTDASARDSAKGVTGVAWAGGAASAARSRWALVGGAAAIALVGLGAFGLRATHATATAEAAPSGSPPPTAASSAAPATPPPVASSLPSPLPVVVQPPPVVTPAPASASTPAAPRPRPTSVKSPTPPAPPPPNPRATTPSPPVNPNRL